ncbi:MAG: hypothetical protein BAJALOKI3v1_150044 [Promethearchaeota archaeon]|nr:MAG: hypothetical protein BAJALOKI3v1_150044 [Candidatus Lokiarchaeota archaeon]
MQIKKINVKPKKVIIDLVLCPKTNLYHQSLYCRRCAKFSKENERFIFCTFEDVTFSKKEPNRQKAKERILSEFQQSSTSAPPQSAEVNTFENSLRTNSKFSKTLERSGYDERDLKRVPVMNELKNKINKNSLSDRLKDINKA